MRIVLSGSVRPSRKVEFLIAHLSLRSTVRGIFAQIVQIFRVCILHFYVFILYFYVFLMVFPFIYLYFYVLVQAPNCTPLTAFQCAGHLCADCADYAALYFVFPSIFNCILTLYLFVFLCIF